MVKFPLLWFIATYIFIARKMDFLNYFSTLTGWRPAIIFYDLFSLFFHMWIHSNQSCQGNLLSSALVQLQ